MNNKTDKSRHLACIQRVGLWLPWRWDNSETTLIQKVTVYISANSFWTDICSRKQKGRKIQIMKLKAFGSVHFA